MAHRFKKTKIYSYGFSLTEFVVAIGIFLMVGSVLMFNYPELNNRSSLDGVAHQIALDLRQVQLFGTSVKETGQGTGVFPGYGLYFSSGMTAGYILFADSVSADKRYSGSSELVSTTNITTGETISDICANLKRDGKIAGDPGSFCKSRGSLDAVHISFTRPNPDATITSTLGGTPTAVSDVEIVMLGKRGDIKRTIVVYPTGQITVE